MSTTVNHLAKFSINHFYHFTELQVRIHFYCKHFSIKVTFARTACTECSAENKQHCRLDYVWTLRPYKCQSCRRQTFTRNLS